EKTREALDEEGWVSSGDIGLLLDDGSIKIIDRKKNIFKLAQGEYIAPEKIENVYAQHNLVQQAYVHGDSLQSQLVAVVVPDPETFIPWAGQQIGAKVTLASLANLAQDPRVVQKLLDDLTKAGKRAGLHGFELCKAIHLEVDPFSIENNLLTPTLKLKRQDAQKKYTEQIATIRGR
ncbi:hypothetical protein BJ085DRAFT_32464, partial [Dimargaris cristalligena]